MKDYYDKVKAILEARPETRDDDMKLYAIFVHKTVGLDAKELFYDVMYKHNEYNLPSYESVTRARRKVQETEPSLQGTKRKRRMELEEECRQYYGR